MLLSTTTDSQLIPVNLVTRPSFVTGRPHRPGTTEVADDDDAIVVEAEPTELAQTTMVSITAGNYESFHYFFHLYNCSRDSVFSSHQNGSSRTNNDDTRQLRSTMHIEFRMPNGGSILEMYRRNL